MSLQSGARLGSYEIVAPIGAGGMGEVYRARDPKLQRDVAIKALPPQFSADPERVARFEREAQALAALNHPGIAGIHELLEHDGARFLVLEYVEGETLAARIERGPIPVDDALPIARQMAEALEAAHEKSIVHRDLKPANIIVRPDGRVKVLDFGLAKALEPADASSPALSQSPTMISMTTGMILGTAAYIAPEQARGKPVDKRADVWAFGAVLYEMLAGKRAFEGEDVSLTLAEVMKSDPDWSALPSQVPVRVNAVLKACLQKNPKERLHDIADVRLFLDGAIEAPERAPSVSTRFRWPSVVAIGVSAVVCGAAVAVATWYFTRPVSAPVLRSVFNLPEGQAFTNVGRQVVAISPDGKRMAYVANTRLFIRSMSEFESKPIAGTETEGGVLNPVFSPDGESIAFWSGADQTIKRIGVSGGAPVTVCEATRPFGLSWQGDVIIFGQGDLGISRVPATGGKPEVLVKVADEERAYGPQILADGRSVLFTVAKGTEIDRWDKAQIAVQQLSSGERKTLITGASDARYVPTGHLVYALGGVLFAVPFDEERLELKGGPVPILEGIQRATTPEVNTGIAHFAFSTAGSLIYVPGPGSITPGGRDLAVLDRKGNVQRLKLASNAYETPRVSPDGKRLAYSNNAGGEQAVYIYDLSGISAPRRLTFGGRNRFPVWSPDGTRVAFQSNRDGDIAIFWQRADGTDTPERLTRPESGSLHIPEVWHPSGDTLLYTASRDTTFMLSSLSMRDKKSSPFGGVKTTLVPQSVFSPDGRWVAYRATNGVYVQPFPPTGALYQIGRGHSPLWSANGQEIYLVPGQGQQISVSAITMRPTVNVGTATMITTPFPFVVSALNPRAFDMLPDGRLIVPILSEGALTVTPSPRIHIVANWFEELSARVPIK